MNAYPFSLYKRSNRPYYFVSYKDENGKPLNPISTKMKDEKEALQVAFNWLRCGVPKKNKVVSVGELSLKDTARKIKSEKEAELLLSELKRNGCLKSYVLKDTPAAENCIEFLSNFWDWEKSPYINDKLRKKHSIHKRHCKLQKQAINLYWKPYFENKMLGEITSEDIDGFINYMDKQPVSSSRKNCVIKAGFQGLRWAFDKGKIEKDPTRNHTLFSGEETKRNILTPSVAAAVFRASWFDERAKLANMLAAVTGMRSGEIIALQYRDLGSDCLYVNNSWNIEDGFKLPKNNEVRTVEIPFPDLMNGLFELAKNNPWGVSPDSYVFWSEFKKDRPIQPYMFVDGLRAALVQIGYSIEEAKKYVFHGWRHFYTSYMIKRLDRKLLKSQTGHKTDEMLMYYADHETEGDREIIQATEREIFAGLLPERPKVLIFKKEPLKIAACG